MAEIGYIFTKTLMEGNNKIYENLDLLAKL
jgi:hypothetical protein